MDICLESFNPYNTDTDVINEGVNIFSKALEALSKIWHKILNAIKSIIDKFKKKSKNEPEIEDYDSIKKDVKKYLIKNNVTTIEATVLTGLGPMFKSFDDLIDYIELLDSGLDIVSKFYSTSIFSSETLSSLESEVASYLADVAKSSKVDINPSNPLMWGVLVSKAMRDREKGDDTEKNILEDHFGYNLTEIYNNNEYHKFKDVANNNSSKADNLAKMAKSKSNISSSNLDKRQRERIEKLQSAMKGIIDINTSAGVDLLMYIASIVQVRIALSSAVLAIHHSEISSLLKPKNESCFAYIRRGDKMDINLNSFVAVNEIKYTEFILDPSKPEFYDEDKFDKNLKKLEKDLNLEIKSDKYFEDALALIKLAVSIIQIGVAFNVGLWGKFITLIVGNVAKSLLRVGTDNLEYRQAKLINKDTKYSPEDHANMLMQEMSKAYDNIDRNTKMSPSDKKKAKDILEKNMDKLRMMFEDKESEFISNRTPGLKGINRALSNNKQAFELGGKAIKNQMSSKRKVNENFSYLMK